MSAADWINNSGSVNRGRPSVRNLLIGAAVLLALLIVFLYFVVWRWMVCRVEVQPGFSLSARYKGPFPPFLRSVPPSEGRLVKLNSWGLPEAIGVLEEMPGPGRHFFSPWEYELAMVPDVVVKPGEIGVVSSKVGEELPKGEILAEADGYKGIWRRVLTPGRYRLNTAYVYEVKTVPIGEAAGGSQPNAPGTALIPPGYVGVVTNRAPGAGETQGIQPLVLQPGLYYVNPYEKKVDVISVGYNDFTLNVSKVAVVAPAVAPPIVVVNKAEDFIAEPDPIYVAGTGIDFPSADGFQIHLDFTAIWGVLPEQAPGLVKRFGTLDDVKKKVIQPQIGSVCRINGSKRGAVEMLVGDSREEFQLETSQQLSEALKEKEISLLFGLTRHIYVPAAVREPIQRGKIADELKLTRDQEQLTAKAQGELTEAIAKVTLEERRTMAETEKLVAELVAEGQKTAKEIEATTEKVRFGIEAQTALVDAQITSTIGEATAMKTELANKAEAERYGLYVKALGGAENYNRYLFAESLPSDINLSIFYAGPGTFWTDLKGLEQTMMGKLVSESAAKTAAALPGGK